MTGQGIEQDRTARPSERLIVALDVPSAVDARSLVQELGGLGVAFKVGLQLFTSGGAQLVEELVAGGHRVFLDLKFHDIPNTVAKAGVEAARLGVWMFNLHASGGSEMMRRTVEEVSDFCSASNRPRPLIIGVTVLTSSDVSILRELGIDDDVETAVGRLGNLAKANGLDGVVASAREVGVIRRAVSDRGFCIVTPGIRPENATKDDQMRVMTPRGAILAGADHIVVGRPITGAADRREAAERILNEIGEAL